MKRLDPAVHSHSTKSYDVQAPSLCADCSLQGPASAEADLCPTEILQCLTRPVRRATADPVCHAAQAFAVEPSTCLLRAPPCLMRILYPYHRWTLQTDGSHIGLLLLHVCFEMIDVVPQGYSKYNHRHQCQQRIPLIKSHGIGAERTNQGHLSSRVLQERSKASPSAVPASIPVDDRRWDA